MLIKDIFEISSVTTLIFILVALLGAILASLIKKRMDGCVLNKKVYNNCMKKKIELAPQDKMEELQPYINKVIKALGHSESLVTDESIITDFLDIFDGNERERQIKKAQRKLKVDIYYDDYVWEVAERVRRANER